MNNSTQQELVFVHSFKDTSLIFDFFNCDYYLGSIKEFNQKVKRYDYEELMQRFKLSKSKNQHDLDMVLRYMIQLRASIAFGFTLVDTEIMSD